MTDERLAAIRADLAKLDAAQTRRRVLPSDVPPGAWQAAYDDVLEATFLAHDDAIAKIRFLLAQLDAAQTRLAEIAAGDCDNCHFLSIEKDRLAGERDDALAERDAARGEVARLKELREAATEWAQAQRGYRDHLTDLYTGTPTFSNMLGWKYTTCARLMRAVDALTGAAAAEGKHD